MVIFPVCNKLNTLKWIPFWGCWNLPDFCRPPAIPTRPTDQRRARACPPVCVCSPTRQRVYARVPTASEVQADPDADRPPRRAKHEQSVKKPISCQLVNLRFRKTFDPTGCRPRAAGRAGGQVA